MAGQQMLPRLSFHSSTTSTNSSETEFVDLGAPVSITKVDAVQDVLRLVLRWLLHLYLVTRRSAVRLGRSLLPSFLPLAGDGAMAEAADLHAIAALDGLRGYACLCVFNYHVLFVFSHSCQLGWNGEEGQRWLTQLPFLRILSAGHVMVFVFFVISGYVLSHKPLKLLRSRNFAQLSHSLASSIFRRAIRLYGPTLIATFFTMLLAHSGLFVYGESVSRNPEEYRGIGEQHPPHFESLHEQLYDWSKYVGSLTNVWNWELFFGDYDPHLWTIPLEFRSSMILFGTLLGLARLRFIPRMACLSAILWYTLWWARWEVFLFLVGTLIAELDLANGLFQSKSLLDEKSLDDRPVASAQIGQGVWMFVFVVGLYLGSSPSMSPEKTPGYMYLTSLVPDSFSQGATTSKFWQAIGGILIVWSILRVPTLQKPFTTHFAQYLGKISYSFYIVHGPILHGFGYNVILWFWSYTDRDTTLGYCTGLFLGVSVILPFVFWTADLFWRMVDAPCVSFAKWLELRFSVSG